MVGRKRKDCRLNNRRFLLTHGKGSDGLTAIQSFFEYRLHRLLSAYDAVAEKFRMHAQMFLVIEVGHNRIWQGAEADLNGVAVLNQRDT